MSDRRSRMIFVGALALVCATAMGCREDEIDWSKKLDVDSGSQGQVTVDNNTPGSKVAEGVPEICRNSEKCMTASECIGDAAYVACRCVVDQLCTENVQCKGINDSAPGSDYTCDYQCGEKLNNGSIDTCAWGVCVSDPKCNGEGECTQASAARKPGGDEDNDGIPNNTELAAGWNPCNPDTDGDTVPDGLEDLNRDGLINKELGESDPNDPKSHPDTTTGEVPARESACDASSILKGTHKTVGNVNVALFSDLSESNDYYLVPAQSGKTNAVLLLNDAKTGVYGSYSQSAQFYTLRNAVVSALMKRESFIQDLSDLPAEGGVEGQTVPVDTWVESGYDEKLQIVPKHKIWRKQFGVLNVDHTQVTPRMVRDSIAATLSGNPGVSVTTFKASEACETDEMKVYIVSSFYTTGEGGQADNDDSTIYSVGVTCAEKMTDSEKGEAPARTRMKDIISGTMVAPSKYLPYKQFMCQSKSFGDSSGMIDFIWMVDNSGSMVDEQAAVAATAEKFMNSLGNMGIDYRIGVAFTDAYVLDEAEPGTSYHANNLYVDENGLRVYSYANQSNVGFLTPRRSGGVGGTQELLLPKLFTDAITRIYNKNYNMMITCDRSKIYHVEDQLYKDKNLCGYGLEDGLKSTEYVLKSLTNPPLSVIRSSVSFSDWPKITKEECKKDDGPRDVGTCTTIAERCYASSNVAPHCYDENDGGVDAVKCYDELLEFYTTNDFDICKFNLGAIKLRDKALKYVVWVSDEMSRQFKEDSEHTINNPGAMNGNSEAEVVYGTVPVCANGYRVSSVASGDITSLIATPWEMFPTEYGPCYYNKEDGKCYREAEHVSQRECNPKLKWPTKSYEIPSPADPSKTIRRTDYEIERTCTGTGDEEVCVLPVNEASTLAEVKDHNEDMYNVIMHYITSYLQYAGTGGIAGFVIVGDDAPDNYDKNKKGGNGSCKYLVDGTPDGADYGFDYILTARYLSAAQKHKTGMYVDEEGNFNFGGAPGHSGSICNPKYDEIVTDLLNDAVGRAASHYLKAYPISSTIQVSVKPANGSAVKLVRGAKQNGWSYNESQNSIVLSGVSNMTSDAYLAIAYVIWKKDEG